MADHIATQGVHHFRLTVSNVDRAVASYTIRTGQSVATASTRTALASIT